MRSFVLSLACLGLVAAAPVALTSRKLAEAPNIVELAQSVPTLSTLVAAVIAADLVDVLSSPGPFTVLAPTNAAFDLLPPGELARLLLPANKPELVSILLYHTAAGAVFSPDLSDGQVIDMVEGSSVTARLNGVDVIFEGGRSTFGVVQAADNRASNGVVHIIDAVLLPPIAPTLNIVQLAQSVPDLSTLVTAVIAGGLVETLSGPGPFTVFAPTNAAFAALPAGTLEFLLLPANLAQLQAVLTYHVAAGAVRAGDLQLFQLIPTVEGSNVEVAQLAPTVLIRGGAPTNLVQVVAADNEATNGVVHLVDNVLLPPGDYGSWSNFTSLHNITA